MATGYFEDRMLDFWVKNGLNVLLRGKHGVGKTARVIEAFERNKLKWQYFSAATMDPWVDFIGVPQARTDADGRTHLDLIRPKVWEDGSVEAIFLDEFNRANKKTRNAVMELIQFKSINGKKFPNLKIVWAAINPEDEEQNGISRYDVEALDPAQKDRFHVCVDVPYEPDATYFRKKYTKDAADSAISWWKQLGPKEKDEISPRRLDYMLDVYLNMGGDIKPMIGKHIQVQSLLAQLKNGPISRQVDEIFARKSVLDAKKLLSNENTYEMAKNHILSKKELMEFYLPNMNAERVAILMTADNKVKTMVLDNYEGFKDLIHSIAATKSGALSTACEGVIMKHVKLEDLVGPTNQWKNESTEKQFQAKLASLQGITMNSPASRTQVYEQLVELLPETMSTNTAIEALRLIAKILVPANVQAINTKYPKLVDMFKHTIDILSAAGMKWEGLVDQQQCLSKLNEVYTVNKVSKSAETPAF